MPGVAGAQGNLVKPEDLQRAEHVARLIEESKICDKYAHSNNLKSLAEIAQVEGVATKRHPPCCISSQVRK